MDCCNYLQYRSPYGFGPGYYDHLTDYNHGGNFYGQNLYHDYYNSPYYPQWPAFPDYVYNPKEARIRKAMREASRDRSIGASPMLPRPTERIPSHTDWTQPQEEPLMMSPMAGMRRLDTPLCNYTLPHAENNQYLPPMNGYNKMESPSMMSNYMQPSPLAQLQQQTDMWHPYQENMRTRSLGSSFQHTMMPDVQPSNYQSPEPVQETATNLIIEKPRMSPECVPQSHRQTPSLQVPDESPLISPVVMTNSTNAQPMQSKFMESKMSPDRMKTTILETNHRHDGHYIPLPESDVGSSDFESPTKIEPVTVAKKPRGRPPSKKSQPAPPPPKALPDFNEAFGSTERGRFLSPPDPRLHKNYLDMFFDSDNFMKFDDFQI